MRARWLTRQGWPLPSPASTVTATWWGWWQAPNAGRQMTGHQRQTTSAPCFSTICAAPESHPSAGSIQSRSLVICCFFFFLSFLPFFFCPKTDSQLEGPIVGGSVRSVCVFVRWSRGPQANAGWLPQIELYCHWRLKEKWNSRFKNVPIENNKS